MDIWLQLGVVRDRIRLVVVTTLVVGLGALIFARTLPSEYEAQVRLLVGNIVQAENPELNEVALAERLSRTYAELATTRPVVQAVIIELGLDQRADALVERVTARADLDSPYIDLEVRHRSAADAAAIANAFAGQILELAPTLTGGSLDGSSVSLITIVEPAIAPSAPIAPRVTLFMVVGIVAGLALGLGLAFLLEFLQPRVRAPRSIAAATGWPTLAATPPARATLYGAGADVDHAETMAFRVLVENILAGGDAEDRPQAILVTAATAGSGTTRTAIGLALAAASAGISTVAVDADPERGGLTAWFGAVSSPGFPALIGARTEAVSKVIQSTPYPGVRLVAAGARDSAGSIWSNPRHLSTALRSLRDAADLVVIDGPPVLAGIRAAELALAVDGVALVVDVITARRSDVEAAAAALDRVEAPILGTVANRYRASSWLSEPGMPPALSPALDRVAASRGSAGEAPR